jgi:hypothetical protein
LIEKVEVNAILQTLNDDLTPWRICKKIIRAFKNFLIGSIVEAA